MSVAVERHDWVGFRRAQTTIKVQVPLEERSGASKVDVQVQSEGGLIFGKCIHSGIHEHFSGCGGSVAKMYKIHYTVMINTWLDL